LQLIYTFPFQFIPSDYFNTMKMTLEERIDTLCKIRKNRLLPDPSPFLATPDIIIFQNFTLGKWHNATLTLQNKEQASTEVLLQPRNSVAVL
jgi:hypothetical protein